MSLVGVGWEPVVDNVFELWDVDGIGSNGPSLIGLPRDELMMEDKTSWCSEWKELMGFEKVNQEREVKRVVTRSSREKTIWPWKCEAYEKVEMTTRREICRYERLKAITTHRIWFQVEV
ncbi:hypothetical protein BDR07DRAFT_1381414 [Suillus spraguei]|nr:hypothetical protein BDR07DRAFT_1381414 [Suillus spraguei]